MCHAFFVCLENIENYFIIIIYLFIGNKNTGILVALEKYENIRSEISILESNVFYNIIFIPKIRLYLINDNCFYQ